METESDQGAGTVGDESGGGQGAVEPEDTGPSGGSGADSLGSGFLQRIPEDHRPIVEPYVKQWDAGVTRRFQELHSQYDPYRSFIDNGVEAEQLQAAYQLYDLLNTNPQYLYQLLKAELEGQEEQGLGQQGTGEDPFQGLPPELKAQLDQQQQALEAMANFIMSQNQQTQMQQEDAALDEYLGLLRTEFGEFDEDYVIAKMARGMDGAKAVQDWKSAIQQYVTTQDRSGKGTGASAPPILHGGGAIPGDGTDVAKASSKDIVSLTANLLKNANAQAKG